MSKLSQHSQKMQGHGQGFARAGCTWHLAPGTPNLFLFYPVRIF